MVWVDYINPQIYELWGYYLLEKRKPTEIQWAILDFLAERTRFELVVGLLLRQFSKLVVSATHPPLLNLSRLRLALICSANLAVIFVSAKFF